MKYLLLVTMLGCTINTFSQKDTTTYGFVNGTFIQPEIKSCYPGGDAIWKRFLEKNLNYPRSARRQNIKGVVTIAFTVNEMGQTSSYEVVKSLSPDLDNEAIRLIKLSKFWVPAVQNGKQVTYRNRVDIPFPLPDENNN